MKRRDAQYNPKRKILVPTEVQARKDELDALAKRARYGGNPEHKKNPGDCQRRLKIDPLSSESSE